MQRSNANQCFLQQETNIFNHLKNRALESWLNLKLMKLEWIKMKIKIFISLVFSVKNLLFTNCQTMIRQINENHSMKAIKLEKLFCASRNMWPCILSPHGVNSSQHKGPYISTQSHLLDTLTGIRTHMWAYSAQNLTLKLYVPIICIDNIKNSCWQLKFKQKYKN